MPQHIIIADYDPSWPQKYREEEKRLKQILGENCMAMYHIGSTSVPGLAAKPILDILPVVKSLEKVDEAAAVFRKKSAMNIWASSESRAGGISAKAGRNERTKSICFKSTT